MAQAAVMMSTCLELQRRSTGLWLGSKRVERAVEQAQLASSTQGAAAPRPNGRA